MAAGYAGEKEERHDKAFMAAENDLYIVMRFLDYSRHIYGSIGKPCLLRAKMYRLPCIEYMRCIASKSYLHRYRRRTDLHRSTGGFTLYAAYTSTHNRVITRTSQGEAFELSRYI